MYKLKDIKQMQNFTLINNFKIINLKATYIAIDFDFDMQYLFIINANKHICIWQNFDTISFNYINDFLNLYKQNNLCHHCILKAF